MPQKSKPGSVPANQRLRLNHNERNLIVGDDRGEFPLMIGDKGECSVILVYDYDSSRFVANGAAEGESAARSGIEESL
jgi:hypothetical protein